ncbi:MAG TPA: type IV pilus assembly protein PilM, partial [Pirellulales bacterium]
MAKAGSVWGIDLGQCALKALRCRAGDDDGTVTAEAFDYIEYPKMLSQPDANPAELIAEALSTFLSRNSVRGDRVAISVSGQSGLSRFIKLPPVETKKIPDIVKYEARQQIPFALEDVVWDYQQMGGGSVEEGFALETEVGLFAMKRDQVYRALRPFTEAGIDIDVVQLTPVALYNFIVFDQMGELAPAAEFNPEDPPPSTIVMSLGADMSDLVVTNGYRVWQRTVNLGGNHFTKALTKQMKLTFAKAEHLKRNAMKAEDPKAVFQAMRPVFGELLGEVQRTLSFFQNVDRTAKLGHVVPLGNAMKLRGLHKYLEQNL